MHMNSWLAGLIQVPDAGMTIEGWWQNSLSPSPKEQRRNVAALLMYASWNIWKERNRRTFEGKVLNALQVF